MGFSQITFINIDLFMTNRRRFIRNCAALATSAAVVPALVIARRDAGIGLETFSALLNTKFAAHKGEGDTQTLMLVGVEGVHQTFAVLFRGDAAYPLAQDTYRFAHEQLGEFEMFIVPVGRSERSGCYYEAVFNRTFTNQSYG
jgi:hypothetical protein